MPRNFFVRRRHVPCLCFETIFCNNNHHRKPTIVIVLFFYTFVNRVHSGRVKGTFLRGRPASSLRYPIFLTTTRSNTNPISSPRTKMSSPRHCFMIRTTMNRILRMVKNRWVHILQLAKLGAMTRSRIRPATTKTRHIMLFYLSWLQRCSNPWRPSSPVYKSSGQELYIIAT